MPFLHLLLLFVAAILGGILNSVAGGGSFVTFPALIYVNTPAIQANATSTLALWPGSLAAAWALRKELLKQNMPLLLVLGITSFVGGTSGAILLLKTPQTTFEFLIPFLLLAATLLFAVSPWLTARLRERAKGRQKEGETLQFSRKGLVGIALLQLVIAVYGGYFGGGIGILMLATLGMMGMENIHEMNAIKNPLAACINGVAVVTFVIAGAIIWFSALLMIVGAIVGGFGGAYYARKLDSRLVRAFVILVGCIMTIYFFLKK